MTEVARNQHERTCNIRIIAHMLVCAHTDSHILAHSSYTYTDRTE